MYKRKTDSVSSKKKLLKAPLCIKYQNSIKVKDSEIHGKGVFTEINIPASTYIIEYIGELIGKCMSDKRERKYIENNQLSVYMFKITDDIIIDATQRGNQARYINHSCDPNCMAVTVVKSLQIKYYALKDIKAGTELTIDYNLRFENEGISCNCGAKNCKSRNRIINKNPSYKLY